jgi:hypothetical protein
VKWIKRLKDRGKKDLLPATPTPSIEPEDEASYHQGDDTVKDIPDPTGHGRAGKANVE